MYTIINPYKHRKSVSDGESDWRSLCTSECLLGSIKFVSTWWTRTNMIIIWTCGRGSGSSSWWSGRGSAALTVQNGCQVSSLCSGQHASNWVQRNWVHLLKRCTQVWLSGTCTSFHCCFYLISRQLGGKYCTFYFSYFADDILHQSQSSTFLHLFKDTLIDYQSDHNIQYLNTCKYV